MYASFAMARASASAAGDCACATGASAARPVAMSANVISVESRAGRSLMSILVGNGAQHRPRRPYPFGPTPARNRRNGTPLALGLDDDVVFQETVDLRLIKAGLAQDLDRVLANIRRHRGRDLLLTFHPHRAAHRERGAGARIVDRYERAAVP